jgi:hypothetical protein
MRLKKHNISKNLIFRSKPEIECTAGMEDVLPLNQGIGCKYMKFDLTEQS